VGVVVAGIALLGDDDGGRRRLPLLPTTTHADLSGVELFGVDGTTTSTTLVPGAGPVVFRGVVRTAGGAFVPGAVVRAEWGVTTDPPTVLDTRTDAEGRFELTGLYGGRWSVRAWRTPDFATVKVESLFVGDTEARDFELMVAEAEGFTVTHAIEPDPPITRRNARLVVAFSERAVDADGRLVDTPVPRLAVTLVGSGEWERVDGDEEQRTSAEGRVEWIVRCGANGRQQIGVSTRRGTEFLALAACIPLSATTTTTTEPPPTTTTARP
jgi:hypothetical protein